MRIYTDLSYLTPDTEAAARQFLARLSNAGLSPKVNETYRTQERQNALYYWSVEHPDKPKTHSRRSWHMAGRGIDLSIAPATVKNILTFLDIAHDLGFSTVADPEKVRAIVAAGGNPSPALWDWHHVSYHNGRTLERAIVEYRELNEDVSRGGISFEDVVNFALITSALYALINAAKNSRR